MTKVPLFGTNDKDLLPPIYKPPLIMGEQVPPTEEGGH